MDEKKNSLLTTENEYKITPKKEEPLTNYEKTLAKAKSTDLSSVEKLKIVSITGKDKEGIPVVCFLEGNIKDIDSNLVFLYFIRVLDQVVKSNYCLVWCVDNSINSSRPGFSWLLNAYKTITRE